MGDPARAYRQFAGQGASLVNLVIQSYDQILNALYAAIRFIEANRIEPKVKELNHALLLVGHLQNALDFKAGPEVARNLERFYNLARTRILKASSQNSVALLQEVAGDFTTMRHAWEEVEKSVASTRESPTRSAGSNPYASIEASYDSIDWSA